MLFLRAVDPHAHRLQGTQRCEAILARQKARDIRDTFRDTAQHERAMGDRLVAGDGDVTLDSAARLDAKALHHTTARG